MKFKDFKDFSKDVNLARYWRYDTKSIIIWKATVWKSTEIHIIQAKQKTDRWISTNSTRVPLPHFNKDRFTASNNSPDTEQDAVQDVEDAIHSDYRIHSFLSYLLTINAPFTHPGHSWGKGVLGNISAICLSVCAPVCSPRPRESNRHKTAAHKFWMYRNNNFCTDNTHDLWVPWFRYHQEYDLSSN